MYHPLSSSVMVREAVLVSINSEFGRSECKVGILETYFDREGLSRIQIHSLMENIRNF